MPSQNTTLSAFTDAAADAVARAIAGMQREWARERDLLQREREAYQAEARALASELRERLAGIERSVAERLALVKDGNSISVDDVRPIIAEAVREASELSASALRVVIAGAVEEKVAAIELPAPAKVDLGEVRAIIAAEVAALPPAKDGESPDPAVIEALVEDRVARAMEQVPHPKDGEPGKDADPELIRQMIHEAVAALPPAKDGETPDPELIRAVVGGCVTEAVASMPKPRDGKDADPDLMRQMVDEAVARIPPARDGETPSQEVLRSLVAEAVSSLPPPAAGKDADPEVMREMIRAEVATLPTPKDGEPGKDGRLPIVKAWEDRVHYAGECCTFDGGTYQASRDTGRSPPHEDWTCIAAKGADGQDAEAFDIRGTYDPEAEYRRLSVVALGGASFIARRNDPGPCPGEGWQLVATQGKRGVPGPRGEGAPGPAGPGVIALDIDADGILTLTNGDGSTVAADLYPLLSKL